MGKTILRYWLKVIGKAWDSAEKDIGVKGLVIDLFIALIVLIIYWLNHGRPPLQELDEGAMIAICVFFSLIMIALVFYIFSSPAILDKEQEEKIKEHQQADEIAKAMKITITEINNGLLANIKVYNGDKKRTFTGQLLLTKLNGEITAIQLGMFVNFTRVAKLDWAPEFPRIIELISMDKDSRNTFIVSPDIGHWEQLESGKHKIETKLVGTLGGIEINPKKTNWILTIDKENSKVELKRKSRNKSPAN